MEVVPRSELQLADHVGGSTLVVLQCSSAAKSCRRASCPARFCVWRAYCRRKIRSARLGSGLETRPAALPYNIRALHVRRIAVLPVGAMFGRRMTRCGLLHGEGVIGCATGKQADSAARVTRLCDGLSGNEIGPVHGAVLLFVNSRPSQGTGTPRPQVRAADENGIAGMQVSSRSKFDDPAKLSAS